MRYRDTLKLRGAVDMLRNAIGHVQSDPWEPDWYVDFEDGKYGHAASVEEALRLLRGALYEVKECLS